MVQSVCHTPNCRDSRINHMFRNNISYAWQLNNTPKPRRPGVRCTTSAVVCTSCIRSVQENGSIGLVVLQTAEILGLIIYFAIHFLCVTLLRNIWLILESLQFGVWQTDCTILLYTKCTRSTYQSWGRTPYPWPPRLRGIIQLSRIGNVLRNI